LANRRRRRARPRRRARSRRSPSASTPRSACSRGASRPKGLALSAPALARSALLARSLALRRAARTRRHSVGSKNFTEELILGELYAQVLEDNGIRVTRRLDLGGTDIAMAALRRGEIDLYPEYTGTALLVVLKANRRRRRREIYAS
jgi:glycine betaine/choline ABC-type transport system substrate-binding protein